MYIKDLYRNVIFNVISAIIIVLSWYILYYLFKNYRDLLYFSGESTLELAREEAENLNIIAFFGIYFFIELVNYYFNNLTIKNYALLQIVLDGCLFLLFGEILRGKVFFIPSNSADNQYVVFKSYIDYFQQYLLAAFFSNIIVVIINGIRILVKWWKEK